MALFSEYLQVTSKYIFLKCTNYFKRNYNGNIPRILTGYFKIYLLEMHKLF